MTDLKCFNERQIAIIKKAESLGLDTTDLTKTYTYESIGGSIFRQTGLSETATKTHESAVFTEAEMEEILLGLMDQVNVRVYTLTKQSQRYAHIIEEVAIYNAEQMREIRLGLKAGVEVNWYTSPAYDENQMKEIRKGLLEGLRVEIYATDAFDALHMNILRQMLRLRNELFNNNGYVECFRYADVSLSDTPKPIYRTEQLIQILQGMLQGIPYGSYDSVSYSADQMEEIRLGLLNGVDISLVVRPSYSSEEMRKIRIQMEKESKLKLKPKKPILD